jgi:hypothetical protein
MHRKGICSLLFIVLAGISSISRAVAPQAADLHGYWRANVGKCGTLLERNGAYEFTNNVGKTCIHSVGSDFVIFVENNGVQGGLKQYAVIPIARIAIRLLQ